MMRGLWIQALDAKPRTGTQQPFPSGSMQRVTVSVFLVRALIEILGRSGISRTDVLAQAALDPRVLDDPQTRLELEQLERILAAAAHLTGDQALGLRVAEQILTVTFGLLGQLAALAPTLREGLAIGSRFGSLAMDCVGATARDEGDTVVLRCEFPRGTPLWNRTFSDLMIAGLLRLVRSFGGSGVTPRSVAFEYEKPGRHREYARLFGSNLRFLQNETSVAFDRELADRLRLDQHPELYALLRTEAQRRLDRVVAGDHTTGWLRQYLLAIPPARIPNVASVARDLRMSERSLRRHLAAEGTSYRDFVRSAREASAYRLLEDRSRTVKEASAVLGFADAAAFVRAFKRWTGMTPGEYRRTRRRG